MQSAIAIICKRLKLFATQIESSHLNGTNFILRLFFDKNVFKYIPVATAMAFITWLYVTWFIYFRPFVFDNSLYSLFFLVATFFSWYNFYKAWKTDPGVLLSNRDQMSKVKTYLY